MGLRREVRILGPVALLLLVLLAAFTLFSYRSAVGLLVEERRAAALATAEAVARLLAAGEVSPDAAGLAAVRRTAPGVRSLTLLDPGGRELAVVGELPGTTALGPFPEAVARGGVPPGGLAAGPGSELPDAVAALVPVTIAGEPRLLRVDLPAPVLAARRRALAPLTWLVLGVGTGVGVLVLLFLRHLMGPYEALLVRARQIGGEAGGAPAEEDEVAFLVRTFERGMAALARAGAEGAGARTAPDEQLAAIERTLSESLESGLLLLDREGRVLALNPVGAELLGVPPPPPGSALAEALVPHPELVELLSAAVAEGRALQRHEIELAGPPGSGGAATVRTLGLTVHPLRVAAGGTAGAEPPPEEGAEVPSGVRGFLVLFADLTEARRQAQEAQLAESLVRLGELAAGVAHELRNSLATIRGYLALIERRPGEAAGEHLAEVRRETDHLQRVLEDFLSFARPGSVRLEELAVGDLVRRAAADPSLAGTTVRFDDGGLGGERLLGDPQLLERALRNLLHNAARAAGPPGGGGGAGDRGGGGEPGEVEIWLLRVEGSLEVAVADRGAGVPAELRDRLFHPFATGRPDGVGLGLALTQRIVSLHGGSVRVEDRAGGGTVAVMRLPAGTIVT